jgi:ABC-type lipoprotein release transport system permease subunit
MMFTALRSYATARRSWHARGSSVSLVFGVPVRAPATFAAVAIALTALALIACCAPARRASRVDPMVALRED